MEEKESNPSPEKSGNSSTDSVEHDTKECTPPHCRSPSTSSQKCSMGKRKISSIESENSDTGLTAKRLLSESSDSSRSGNSSPLSGVLPHKTCNWTDLLFPPLHISEDKRSEDAMIIFSNAYYDFLKDEGDMFKELNAILNLKPSKQLKEEQKCFEHAVTCGITIDCELLDDVTIADLEHMEVKMNEVLVSASNLLEDTGRNIWERTVWRSLEMFLSQLFHMVRRRTEDPDGVSEGMFTELFMCFMKIFGLEIFGFSNVKNYKLKVGNGNVISKPDAIIYNPRQKNMDCSQVIAVVKVKKNYSMKKEYCSDLELQSRKKMQHSLDYLASEVKGQHLGEMLTLLPSSVFGTNGIFGFIVQGTNVTFVSLAVEKNYLECLASGNLQKKCGKVAYSKEYNILSKSGRLSLVQMLSHLSVMLKYLNKCYVRKRSKMQN